MTFLSKVQPYAVITLDLNVARSVTPIGSITTNTGVLLDTWIANQLLINTISTGGAFSVGVQDGTLAGGMITATAGLKISGVPFDDIFFTNTSQPGLTSQIVVAYID
jgi:hypothetical protein